MRTMGRAISHVGQQRWKKGRSAVVEHSSLYLISVAENGKRQVAAELVGGHLVSLTSQQENSRTGAVIGMLDEDQP